MSSGEGKNAHTSIQDRLNSFIFKCRTTHHRNKLIIKYSSSYRIDHFFFGNSSQDHQKIFLVEYHRTPQLPQAIFLSIHLQAISTKSSGISISSNVIPISCSFHTMALPVIRSTTPLNVSSAPIGTCRGIASEPNFSLHLLLH
jgi:hypothetical protein